MSYQEPGLIFDDLALTTERISLPINIEYAPWCSLDISATDTTGTATGLIVVEQCNNIEIVSPNWQAAQLTDGSSVFSQIAYDLTGGAMGHFVQVLPTGARWARVRVTTATTGAADLLRADFWAKKVLG